MSDQQAIVRSDAGAEDAGCKELAPWEKYTDLDRLKYAAALFCALLALGIGITFRIWPLIIAAFACVWLIDCKGRDVYRSFRRLRRRRR